MSIDYSQLKSVTVFAADVPARWRPVAHTSGNAQAYYWREDLVRGLFVGDVLTWKSENGILHTGVAFGEEGQLIKILVNNWCAYVGIETLHSVNGRLVYDR